MRFYYFRLSTYPNKSIPTNVKNCRAARIFIKDKDRTARQGAVSKGADKDVGRDQKRGDAKRLKG